MTQLVPVLSTAIAPTIQAAIQSAFKDLTDTIQKRSTKLDSLSQKFLEVEKSNEDLQNHICNLEDTIIDPEQYGRRIVQFLLVILLTSTQITLSWVSVRITSTLNWLKTKSQDPTPFKNQIANEILKSYAKWRTGK